MKMEVTELGPMKRALKIEVPADEVAQQFSRAYLELNRQVQIPGFRPGKAPVAILEKRGFVEGTSHAPGDYVIERAFVEK